MKLALLTAGLILICATIQAENLNDQLAATRARINVEFSSDSLLADAIYNITQSPYLRAHEQQPVNYTTLLLRAPDVPNNDPTQILSKLSLITGKPYGTVSLSQIAMASGFDSEKMIQALNAKLAFLLLRNEGHVHIGIEIPSSSEGLETMRSLLSHLSRTLTDQWVDAGPTRANLANADVILFSSVKDNDVPRILNHASEPNALVRTLAANGFPETLLSRVNQIVPISGKSMAIPTSAWTLYLRAPSTPNNDPQTILANPVVISIDKIIQEERKDDRISARIYREITKAIQRHAIHARIAIELPNAEKLKKHPSILESLHQIASTQSFSLGNDEVWVANAHFSLFFSARDEQTIEHIQTLENESELKDFYKMMNIPEAFLSRMNELIVLPAHGCGQWL